MRVTDVLPHVLTPLDPSALSLLCQERSEVIPAPWGKTQTLILKSFSLPLIWSQVFDPTLLVGMALN